MPNWCYTQVVIYGSKTKESEIALNEIEEAIKAEKDIPRGPGILECAECYILEAFGIDCEKLSCRGDILDTGRTDENILHVICEDAWAPNTDVWDVLTKYFNEKGADLQYVYMAEEPGLGVFINSDTEEKFFPYRYKLEIIPNIGIPSIGIKGNEEISEYFKDEASIVKFMNSKGYHFPDGTPFTSLDEIRTIFRHYSDSFDWAVIAEFEKV